MTARDWWQMLSAEDGAYHELRFRVDAPDVDDAWSRVFVPVAERDRFVRLFEDPCPKGRVQLEDFSVSLVPRRAPLPEGAQHPEYLGLSRVVWVRLDNGKQWQALQAFRPAPTVVLREGGSVHRWAIWWLTRDLNVAQVERANKRLAHALGCKKKWADPGAMVPVPGTVLRLAASGQRATAVHVEQVSGEMHGANRVFGRLQDAPEPRDWREAA